MPNQRSLKQRMHDGDPLSIVYLGAQPAEAELQQRLAKESVDLVLVDIQHAPTSDAELIEFCRCANALDVPVLLRLLHPRLACLAGRYADFGVLGVLVPMVEAVEVVDAAIEAFYYPPVGRRSFGPIHAYGYAQRRDRRTYADWWNATAILAIQIESVEAVTNARTLAKPGVDLVLFGVNDLSFSLESHPESPLRTPQDCWREVEERLRGSGVRVASGPLPFGRFERSTPR
jgi:4-hydroxy-2-oxoheptanedioate aldolase